MTDQTENELRALLAAATPGPWAHSTVLRGHAYHRGVDVLVGNPENIDLAVAMHAALPGLLDRVEAAERRVAAVREVLDQWEDVTTLRIGGAPLDLSAPPAEWRDRLRAALDTPPTYAQYAPDRGEDVEAAVALRECSCGHPWLMHGPEVPGCVECRCRRLTAATDGGAR